MQMRGFFIFCIFVQTNSMDPSFHKSNMFFSVSDDMWDHPNVKRIDFSCLSEYKQKDDIVRYIILMYDKGSRFYLSHKNVSERHAAVASHCGIDSLDDLQDLQLLSINGLPDVVHNILVIQADRVWSLIRMNEQLFVQLQHSLLQSVEGDGSKDDLVVLDKKNKLMDQMGSIHNRLSELEEELYRPSGTNSDIVRAIRFTPERVARMMQ